MTIMTDCVSNYADAVYELLALERRFDDDEGTVSYYNALGQLHRVYGPAIMHEDDTREWFLNGQRHRLDGPAVEYASGTREWFLNGQRHRLDGPAVEYSDGYCAWFIDGKALTEAEWQQATVARTNAA
jgi:hypothetical protein